MKNYRKGSWWLLRKRICPFQKQAPISVWRSEDDIMEPIFSFHLYVRADDWCNSGFQACTASTYTCWAIAVVHNLDFGYLSERGLGIEKSVSGLECSWDLPAHQPLFSSCDKHLDQRQLKEERTYFLLWFQRQPMMMGSHGSKQQTRKNVRKLGLQISNCKRKTKRGNWKWQGFMLSKPSASDIISSARLHFLHLFKQFQQLETSSQNTGDYEGHFSFEPLQPVKVISEPRDHSVFSFYMLLVTMRWLGLLHLSHGLENTLSCKSGHEPKPLLNLSPL